MDNNRFKPYFDGLLNPFIFIYKLIKKRPLIALTLFYITALTILDFKGLLNRPPYNDISLYPVQKTAQIRGRVITPVEKKSNDRMSFLLQTRYLGEKEVSGNTLVNYSIKKSKIDAPEPGDIVNITGTLKKPLTAANPGCFDYSKFLSRKNIFSLMYAKSVTKSGHESLPLYLKAAYKVRNHIVKSINQDLPPLEASILSKMLIGVGDPIPEEETNSFINSGTIPVLVVSGFNVGYCFLVFFWIFRIFGVSPRRSALLAIPFIILYTFVTGANPPVVRATVMAIFIIISMALARESNIYQSLSLSALTICLLDPQALFTASFQLSYAATFGIVYLYPVLFKPFYKSNILIKWLMGLFVVSLSAQIFVEPVLAFYMNKISTVALISNMFVVPLSGVITITGIVLYLFNLIFSNVTILVYLMAQVNYFLLHIMLFLVDFFAKVPFSTIYVATPSIAFIALYYIFLFAITKIRLNFKTGVFLSIFLIVFAAAKYIENRDTQKNLVITFLDVGYGNAVHIKFPDGQNWLLDTGGSFNPNFDVGQRIICPYLWNQGVRKLDKIIITDFSHLRTGGLEAITNNFKVDEIITSGALYQDGDFIKIMSCVRGHRIYLKRISAGDVLISDKSSLIVMSPKTVSRYRQANSLVLQLAYAGNKILFTSDMPYRVQKELALSGPDLNSTVLELPKYGKIGIGEEFMDAVHPKVIVVSKGKNKFYDADEFKDLKVYSTTDNGAIKITFYENERYKIDCFKK